MSLADTRTSTSSRLRLQRFRWLVPWWAPVLLVLAALVMSGAVAIHHSQAMSPVDEWVYIDYLFKVPTEGIVRQGEPIGSKALALMACHGVTPYGTMGDHCGSHYNSKDFPFAGITSADLYTPLYFYVTALFGKIVHVITGINQLTSWRLSGSVWLALGMVLLISLARMLRVPDLVTVGLGLAVIASPYSWWTFSYVSTDAPTFAFGLLLIIAALKFTRGEWPAWVLIAASALAVAFKGTNVIAVCLAALLVLVVWFIEFRGSTERSWRTRRENGQWLLSLPAVAVAAGVAALIVEAVWGQIHSAIAVGPPANQGLGGALGIKDFLSQATNFLPGTITSNVVISGAGGVAEGFAYNIPAWLVMPLSWICVAGVLGGFATLRRQEATRTAMVVATTVAAIAAAPLLAVVVKVTEGSYYALPPRYGGAILGSFLIVAGMTLRNRWARWAVVAYAVLLYVYVFITIPHYAS